MQKTLTATFAAVLLSACTPSAQKPVTPAPAATEATVVFTRTDTAETRLYAQSESGTDAAVPLSPQGARAEFGGKLDGRRIVYTVHAQDGSVKQIASPPSTAPATSSSPRPSTRPCAACAPSAWPPTAP